jgi:hypothetical protein
MAMLRRLLCQIRTGKPFGGIVRPRRTSISFQNLWLKEWW